MSLLLDNWHLAFASVSVEAHAVQVREEHHIRIIPTEFTESTQFFQSFSSKFMGCTHAGFLRGGATLKSS
jgi:hypothetical protein